MKTYYRDFYGSTASVTTYPNKAAKLIMCVAGKRSSKIYTSAKGAKLAMSRASEGWTEQKKNRLVSANSTRRHEK